MALGDENEAAYTAAVGRECVICGRPWPTATNPPDDRLCAACRAVSEADTVPRDPTYVARPDPVDADLNALQDLALAAIELEEDPA
jgi:hypothetical protein